MTPIEAMQQVYAEQGYLVASCKFEFPIGAILPGVHMLHTPQYHVNQPFCIIGLATKEEELAQRQKLALHCQGEELDFSPGPYFYKVVTE